MATTPTADDISFGPRDGAASTFDDAGGDDIIYIHNFRYIQLGVVAEYASGNIPAPHLDYRWQDSSDNALHASMFGATPILEDSWESFWTDFSIMMYEPKTNQLIVMRDCTGVWSRTANHGDAWFVDLDTGAHSTGKQIFTAGARYSNPQIDWNNRLIIAREDSIGSVDILEWSDQPVAQAQGLLIAETIDDDLDTAALKYVMGVVVKMRSGLTLDGSEITYAINGTEHYKAFTSPTITVSSDITQRDNWKRISIIFAGIECYSISIRVTNDNSTATTSDIDEIAIQYDIEEESI